jgi:hypothetical protein
LPATVTDGSHPAEPANGPDCSVTSGLDVLDKIAAAGNDGWNGPGADRPNLQVTITSAG